jgi:DNA-binding NarL/FixJ family response regulator
LRLLARGLTNREIGELLHISEKTVINHLTHIYTKAGVENRAGAVMFAVRYGLASS